MIESASHAAPPGRSEFATGWPILLAAALGTAVTGVHFQVLGAMLNPLHAAYGWSRGDAAFALTIATVITAFVHVPVGILLDRFGPKPILIPGCIAFGLGVALLGLAGPALWTWYAAYALFSVCVVPASSLVWFNAVVRHFEARRGFALAIALVGSGILTALVPAIVLTLTQGYGVRGAYFVMAVGATLLTLPFALFCIPRDMGGGYRNDHAAAAVDRSERQFLLRSGRFWRMVIAVLLISLWIGVFSVHFQPMLTDSGLSPSAAAKEALFMGPTFLLGALGTGVLFDRFSPRFVSAVTFLVPGVVSALLLTFDGDFAFGAIIAVLVGIGLGAPVNVISYSAGHYFEVRHYGFVLGILLGTLSIAIGLGSWLAGSLFDLTGSYQFVHIAMIAGSGIASLLMLSLRGIVRTEPDIAVVEALI